MDGHPKRFDLQALLREQEARVRRLAQAPPSADVVPGHGPLRDFAAALAAPGMAFIAEVKRASPSAGNLAPQADAGRRAAAYQDAGAAAVSVLTEPLWFAGRIEDLGAARASCGLPILRKDFLVDPLQVLEARAAGADAVLLIVACLDPGRLRELSAAAADCGLTALVEVHEPDEVQAAVDAGARVIGVNNRSLSSLQVDLAVMERMAPLLPLDVVRVAESGMHDRDAVRRAEDLGYHAVLVGEALSRAADPAARLRELAGRS